MNLRPDLVRQLIANLLLTHPELFDDDEARALSIESETPAIDYLRSLEHRRREAECNAGALADQIAQLELRQERFVRQEKSCRNIAFKIMEETALPKLVMPEATYSVRSGKRKVIVTDENLIPRILGKTEFTPDKKRIGEMLKDGQQVNGAELSNQEPYLAINTK